jgi:1-acyl-sn-glycerol-3-phosphate acyltransferase
LVGIVKLLVGAYPRWAGCTRENVQRIYFANHSSHIDTLAVWAALPFKLRRQTRPVAAKDYWGKGLRKYIATKSLRAVLIDRARQDPRVNPLEPMMDALRSGDSLIIFPEGTRNSEVNLKPFKSGLFHLAVQFPDVQLVPVYLENLSRSMPKGAVLPIPMTCVVNFGTPIARRVDETKEAFLNRAREAVVNLSKGVDG